MLIQERTRAANRVHKLLEDAGIKLASVATSILGVSGRAMLEALVHGTTDPEVLADLARGKLRKKLPALRQALAGRFRPHHAFLVSQLLAHVDYLDEAIAMVSEEVEGRLVPFGAQLTQLDTIPGINRRTAEVLIAEIGVDMSMFPSDRHLASWAGLYPGNNESAGKHKSGTTRKGSRWLRMGLIEAAAAAVRTKDSALRARYQRVMRHRGHKKAVVAVAHAMLRAVYHLLAEGTTYREPGADRRHTHRITRCAIQMLERQGYRVVLSNPLPTVCAATDRGFSELCLRLQRGCGVRGWGRDGLGTGARGRGARARRALMLPCMKPAGRVKSPRDPSL